IAGARQGAKRRGLAGAVAAEKCDDIALVNLEADALHDIALAIIGVDIADTEIDLRIDGRLGHVRDAHRVHACPPPRYASCTFGLPLTSSGGPSAIIWP